MTNYKNKFFLSAMTVVDSLSFYAIFSPIEIGGLKLKSPFWLVSGFHRFYLIIAALGYLVLVFYLPETLSKLRASIPVIPIF